VIQKELNREQSYEKLKAVLASGQFAETVSYNPLMLAFEITTSCNLKCVRCERRAINPKHLNHHMGAETFDRLSLLFPYVRGISIVGGLGEPIIAPDFWKYVTRMKTAGVQVMYFTNGTCLTDEAIIKTFDLDVDTVAFSIDALSVGVYEKLKTGAHYNKSIDRIDSFLRLRKKNGAKTKLMLNCAVQKDTLEEMIPLVRFAAQREIDKIWFTGVITHLAEQVKDSHLQVPLEQLNTHFQKVANEAQRQGIEIRLPAGVLKNKQMCLDLWTNLYIFYNGDICACPHFREPKTYYYHVKDGQVINETRAMPHTILGNAHNSDVLALWDGPKHREFRRRMLAGQPVFPCRECHFSYDLH
jgi:MoaA/NifB/PqqE/SkfB family radical SAM enzyme